MASAVAYLDDNGTPITASSDVKLPKGYSLLSSKKDTKKTVKPLKDIKAEAAKLKPVAPSAIDFTSNPNNEGLYSMFGRTGAGDAVGEFKVPYSKVQQALKSGSTFYNGSGEVYDKDKSAEGKPVSWYQKIVQSPSLAPVANEKEQPGQIMGNKERAAARTILATPAYVKQLWDAAQSMHRGEVSGGDEFANLINPLQLPKQLYDQYKVDAKTDPKMAADNLLGSLAGLGVVGAVTHGITKAVGDKVAPAVEAPAVVPIEEKLNVPARTIPQVLVPSVSGELPQTPAGTGGVSAGEAASIPHENQPLAETGAEGRGGSAATGDVARPPVGLEQKPLHEMSPAEIEEEHGKAQNRDKQDVIDIFGEEEAKRYNRLQRASNNSYDMQKADKASAELQEMESQLTPEQQNRLYGIGDTRHTVEDLAEYRTAHNHIDDSSAKALGESLKWAVSQVGDPTRAPENMTPKERLRLTQLRWGHEAALRNGYDPMEVMKHAVNSAAERFSDPNDARMMVEDVVKALHINEQYPITQNSLPDEVQANAKEQVDRRVDSETRKRVDQMSPEEMRKALLTSDVTGIPNRRAFDDAEHVSPSPAIGMSDADGLKALNDKFGYAAGNELLKAKSEALRAAGLDAYHEKGDEFLFRGASPQELKEKLDKARELLRNRKIEVTLKDGTKLYFNGADFSYGTGKDIDESEAGLKQHKDEREQKGERKRGELRGITQIEPGGSGEPASAPE